MLGGRTEDVIFAAKRRRSARVARMGAGERNDRGEDGAEQRQENDRLIHGGFQPFIRLMSSTAIVPRLRK
jgi:hypothetical protein